MRLARLGSYLVLAIVAASGCRTAGVDNFTRRDPVLPPPSFNVAKLVEENNLNASRIESLRVNPLALTVTSDRKSAGVEGRLALERPKNFKLLMDTHGNKVAEIGSNDEKFWFWSSRDPDRRSYYCNYDESGSAPLGATFQPDWIIEALGLREIPPDEASKIEVSRGSDSNTMVLTHPASKTGGEVVIRKTIVRESTNEIIEHRLYSQKMELLASAKIDKYQKFAIAGPDGRDEMVTLPERMKINWYRERMALDVVIPKNPSQTQVNPEFTDDVRNELFVEEPHRGFVRQNLASSTQVSRGGVTTIRESLPSPPRGVQLGTPESDPADAPGARRNQVDADAMTASLPTEMQGELVGPSMPQAPEVQYAKPARPSGWIEAASPYLEQ